MRVVKDLLISFFFFFSILLFSLISVALFSSCGKQQVEMSGTVTVKHEISLDDLRQYFIRQCLRENPYYSDSQLDLCADNKISDLLNSI